MKRHRAVLIICDSLRRDLVTPETAPVLTWLARESTWFTQVRSVFPSTTRVSSACIATGCVPGRHGLLGNCMLLPSGDGLANHSAGQPDFRDRLRAATGRTLRVPTLAERLVNHGGACIYSNVSPGAAYFSDPDAYGQVFHRAGSYGPGHVPYPDALDIQSGAAGDAVMTDQFCAMLLSGKAPAVSTLWLSEPDHSGHGHALGSPPHRRAIGQAEACVARVVEAISALREKGEDVLLFIGSDHGMETVLGSIDVDAALVQAGLKHSLDSTEVAVAPNGTSFVVGVAPHVADRVKAIAAFLADQPWCGSLFQGDALAAIGMPQGDPACVIAGTFQTNDSSNAYGVPGASWIAADRREGKSYDACGQHGGLGVNEQAPFLMVQGGGFAAGAISDHPVSLIDYAPTFLRHLSLSAHGMDGHAIPLSPSSFSRSRFQD